MQRLVETRKRMRAVAGIGDVCRTLATVASAKLSQTRERAMGARVYTERLRQMLARQQRAARAAGIDPASLSPLMAPRPVGRVLVVAIGADRGLCGGYNVSIGRTARAFARAKGRDGTEVHFIAKGRRIESYIRRATKLPIDQAAGWTRAGVTANEVDTLVAYITEAFLGRQFDEVWACYTAFLSTVRREPRVVRLLPVAPHQGTADDVHPVVWFYEPDREACVSELLDAFVRLQVEDVLLEAFASEQAARMVTMQEASERADKSLAELRVSFNRLRRESITSDLIGVLVAGRVRGGAGRVA